MISIEAPKELGKKPVLENGRLIWKHYYPRHHPEEGKPVDGWTGPETEIDELIPTNSTLEEKGDLVKKCAWCDPRGDLPVPEGKKGFTDGICDTHKKIILEEIQKK